MRRMPLAGRTARRARSTGARRTALRSWAATTLLAGIALAGCGRRNASPAAETKAPAPPTNAVVFTDVTRAAGIGFVHNSGASGRKYLPDTLGSGVACLDYDGDAGTDLL